MFLLPKGIKFSFNFPERRKKQFFREVVFLKIKLWTVRVHFWQLCQKFFADSFLLLVRENYTFVHFQVSKTRKLIFWTQKKKFWQHRWVSFAIRHKFLIKNPRRKTELQKTIFPQNVAVVHTSTLLRSLLKIFANCFSL